MRFEPLTLTLLKFTGLLMKIIVTEGVSHKKSDENGKPFVDISRRFYFQLIKIKQNADFFNPKN